MFVPGLEDAGEISRVLLARHEQTMRVRDLSPRTITERRRAVLRLARWLRRHRDVADPVHATRADLVEWQFGLAGGQDYRYTERSHVGQYYAWLYAEGYIDSDPAAALPRGRKPKHLPRPMTEQVLTAALARTDDPRILLALVLAAWCGLRCSEIAGLVREDIVDDDPEAAYVVVRHGKGDKPRTVDIGPGVVAVLHTIGLPAYGPVIVRRDGRRGPVLGKTLSNQVSAYLRDTVGTDSRLHAGRHRYATQLYARSLDMRLVADMLGHASTQTTQIYVDLVEHRGREAAKAMDETLPDRLAPVHDLEERRRRRAEDRRDERGGEQGGGEDTGRSGGSGGGAGHRDEPRRATRPAGTVISPLPGICLEPEAVACHHRDRDDRAHPDRTR
jgi:site-specific recombinase XerD